jgi:phosphoribosylamine--glycine ligase
MNSAADNMIARSNPLLAARACSRQGRAMKILLIGSGGREHALAWKLTQSPSLSELVCAPGNPGMASLARCVPARLDDVAGLAALAVQERADLVVVGPEAPLAAGLADKLAAVGIACFGPSAKAAQLESSKAFTKDFCARHAIPTAEYKIFTDALHAKAYLGSRNGPYVIKADGLAAGKGVVIAATLGEADAAIDEALFHKKFGSAGETIIIEDFLPGEEASFFALCDGQTAMPLFAAQDHKRAYDGDKGPNTGGMGAYSPASVFTSEVHTQTMEQIILPTMAGMAAEGAPFVGVLFAGLMVSADGPKLIEYNCRFGDPETQTLMRRIEGDLAATLLAAAVGTLKDAPALTAKNDPAVCIVLAAQGYPEMPLTGSIVRGVAEAAEVPGVEIFHAGTRLDEDNYLRATGGRVLNVSASAPTLREAVDRAYRAAHLIDWPGGFFRSDIAARALHPRG